MKYLILMRHGWAGDSGEFRLRALKEKGHVISDDHRPLDARGRRETRHMAKGLKFLLKGTNIILTSPLVRARQTAEIVQKVAKKKAKIVEIAELKPETPPGHTWQSLQSYKNARQVLVVGHEPHFAKFLSFILTGDTLHPLPFKKGGVAVVAFSGGDKTAKAASKPKGELRCFIQPTHLRKVRKS